MARLRAALGLLLLGGALAQAQEAPRRLAEAQAVELALSESGAVQALRAAESLALAEAGAALVSQGLELRTDPVNVTTTNPAPTYGLGLRWRPPPLKQVGPTRQLAHALALEAQAERAQAEREVSAAVSALYVRLWLADQELRAAEESARLHEQLTTLTRGLTERAAATALDASLTQLSLEQARAQIAQAQQARARAEERLRAQLGLTPGEPVEFVLAADPLADALPSPQEEPRWIAAQLESAPSVTAARARSEVARAEAAITRREALPSLSFFQLGYELAPTTTTPTTTTTSPWSVSVAVALPLPGPVASAGKKARLTRELADAEHRQAAQEAELALREALALARQAYAALQTWRQGPLVAARQAQQEAERMLAAGQLDVREAAQLQERCGRVYDEELARLQALGDAYTELRVLTGGGHE